MKPNFENGPVTFAGRLLYLLMKVRATQTKVGARQITHSPRVLAQQVRAVLELESLAPLSSHGATSLPRSNAPAVGAMSYLNLRVLAARGDAVEPKTVAAVFPYLNPKGMPNEVGIAGKEVRSKEDLSSLEDGMYLYVMTTDGRLFIAPSIPNLDIDVSGYSDDQLLNDTAAPSCVATHLSILRLIQKELGTPDEMPTALMAGEIHVIYGDTAQINNRSGSFKGDSESLQLATQELPQRGLPSGAKTDVVDYSVDGANSHSGHTVIAQRELARLRAASHHQMKPLASIMRGVYKLFPHPERAGRLDIAALRQLGTEARASAKQGLISREASSILQRPLSLFSSVDGDGVASVMYGNCMSVQWDTGYAEPPDPNGLDPFIRDIEAAFPQLTNGRAGSH